MIRARHIIYTCSILLICTSMLAYEIEFLFPDTKHRISFAPSGLFKMLVKSDKKQEVYLLQADSISFTTNIATELAKEEFPKEMYQQFGNDFAIADMSLNFIKGGNLIRELSYNFSTDRPLDLDDFWKTTDFRRILDQINNADSPELEVKMKGWTFKKWVLNMQNEAEHMDMIGASVSLTPGVNRYEIQVRSAMNELVLKDSISYYYYTSYISDTPPDAFTRFDFHTEELDIQCGQCHGEIEDDDCSFCHASVVDQEFTHEPAEEMDCTVCHDESDYPKYELLEDFREDPAACLMCHGEIEELMEEVENLHPPLEESCLVCHDPHSAANPFMIPMRTKDLCMTCHEGIEEGFHPESGHPLEYDQDPRREDRRFNCASCHDPHGSDEESLLRLDYATLCSECHMKN